MTRKAAVAGDRRSVGLGAFVAAWWLMQILLGMCSLIATGLTLRCIVEAS